jgi:hypothetical protein
MRTIVMYEEPTVSVWNLSIAGDNGSYGVLEVIEQIIQSKKTYKENL